MSKIKHALVIYNPGSGKVGDLDRRLGAIVRRLHESSDYIVTVRGTTPGITQEELLFSAAEAFDLVIACGGDGTVGQVLGALADTKSKAKVGIVPFGTGNLMAHHLGIYQRGDVLESALDTILEGFSVPLDLGRMNDRYFIIDAATGPISNALIVPKQRHKRFWGLFVYFLPLLRSMAHRPRIFKISVDGDEPVLMTASGVFVATIGEMGINNAFDYSQLHNGTLDLIVMNPLSVADYWRTTWRFMAWNIFGRTIKSDPPYMVLKIKSAEIDVLSNRSEKSQVHHWARRIKNILGRKRDVDPALTERTTAMVDGDRYGSTPMKIEIVPNAVQIIVPKPKTDDQSEHLQRLDKLTTHAA